MHVRTLASRLAVYGTASDSWLGLEERQNGETPRLDGEGATLCAWDEAEGCGGHAMQARALRAHIGLQSIRPRLIIVSPAFSLLVSPTTQKPTRAHI